MANKKISEFPVTTSLAVNDAFLINHLGSTSTVAFSSVSDTISQTITNSLTGDTVIQKLSGNFIKKPDTATGGQVLTFNGSTSTWVASATPSFTGSNQSLTTNGYQKLPGGLIIQWGITGSFSGSTTVTLPVAFPNGFLQGFAATDFQVTQAYVDPISNTQINVRSGTSNSSICRWFVLGF